MKRFARAVAVAGIAVGVSMLGAPAAFADVEFNTVSPQIQGDLTYSNVEKSPNAVQAQQDKPVIIDDVTSQVKTDVVNSRLSGSPLGSAVKSPQLTGPQAGQQVAAPQLNSAR